MWLSQSPSMVKSRCASLFSSHLGGERERERELQGALAVALSLSLGQPAMLHAQRASTGTAGPAAAFSASKRRPARCPPKAVEREIPSIISCPPSLSHCSSQKSLRPLYRLYSLMKSLSHTHTPLRLRMYIH
jgi:hypothetical protein